MWPFFRFFTQLFQTECYQVDTTAPSLMQTVSRIYIVNAFCTKSDVQEGRRLPTVSLPHLHRTQ